MTKIKNKAIPQTNKNNKTKPENLMKKEYLESYDKLKKIFKRVNKHEEIFHQYHENAFWGSG